METVLAILFCLSILLIGCKLLHIINWSWWIIISPILICIILIGMWIYSIIAAFNNLH
jgi:CHASE2 domain-containing sensor protein